MLGRGVSDLTKVSFRRNVRFFLGALVGFLVLLVVALATILEIFVMRAEVAQWNRWTAVSDAVAGRVGEARAESLPSLLEEVRSTYRLAHVSVGDVSSGSRQGVSVETVERPVSSGILRISFDRADIDGMRRAARLTIAISTAAAGLGLVLLFLYLPRIVAPVEQMLDQARSLGERREIGDDTSYLVDTFRRTIETMKQQRAELERLHEQDKLRATELELLTATLTRSLTSGFVALDPAGSIVDLNGAAREILEVEGNAAGRRLEDALEPSEFTRNAAEAVRARQSLSRVEVAHRGKVIGLTTVPLTNDAGEVLGMMLLFTDVSDVRRLEERLRNQQSLADLGEMSAGIAHEFRNALSTILGYLRIAQRGEVSPDVRSRVAAAEQEAMSLSSTVDALLRFARPMQLDLNRVELAPLLRGVVARFREQWPRVEFREELGGAEVVGDEAALRSCFENLLRNAVEAIGDTEGRVEIACSAETQAVVTICDDGRGVDPADVPRLLLPFQSERAGGVGLGLPLASKIALLHGGVLEMTGEPGRGATVRVTLPRAPVGTKSTTLEAHPTAAFPARRA